MGQYKFKIALIGDYGSGKTSLYRRFVSGEWLENDDGEPTDFAELEVKVGSDTCKISLFDTAGMEEHSAMEGSYFRGLHGFFLVYSVANWQSFERIEYWRDQIELFAVDGVQLVLIGNKSDLPKKERVVEGYEGKKLSAKLQIPFFETSAKSNENVIECMSELASRVINSGIPGISVAGSKGSNSDGTVQLTADNTKKTAQNKKGCC